MISIVVPCFNEAGRIAGTLRRIVAFLEGARMDFEIVVVDDGSVDRTAVAVRDAFPGDPRVRVHRYGPNRGKGFAVREGARVARGELVLFTDADLATPIEELPAFEARAAEGCDLVIASRFAEGARIVTPQPVRRRVSGWVFRSFVRGLGLTRVRDTQCGFKLMRRASMEPVLEAMTTDGYAFDVELIVRAEAAGLRICEQPVEWRDDAAGSKVRLYPDAFQMGVDLIRLRGRLRP